MGILPDVRRRSAQPEIMEDEDGSLVVFRRTLEQFAVINRLFSGARSLIRRHVLKDMSRDPERSYTFLDVGCGSGDLARWLVRTARRRKLNLQVTAVDYDQRVVAVARELSVATPELRIQRADARDLGLTADFVFCNHLLHHFDDACIPKVLGSMIAAAGRKVIVNDVRRSAVAYLLFGLFAWLFLKGSHHRHDGRLSILKGLRAVELRGILEEAGLADRAHVSVRPIARLRLILGA